MNYIYKNMDKFWWLQTKSVQTCKNFLHTLAIRKQVENIYFILRVYKSHFKWQIKISQTLRIIITNYTFTTKQKSNKKTHRKIVYRNVSANRTFHENALETVLFYLFHSYPLCYSLDSQIFLQQGYVTHLTISKYLTST